MRRVKIVEQRSLTACAVVLDELLDLKVGPSAGVLALLAPYRNSVARFQSGGITREGIGLFVLFILQGQGVRAGGKTPGDGGMLVRLTIDENTHHGETRGRPGDDADDLAFAGADGSKIPADLRKSRHSNEQTKSQPGGCAKQGYKAHSEISFWVSEQATTWSLRSTLEHRKRKGTTSCAACHRVAVFRPQRGHRLESASESKEAHTRFRALSAQPEMAVPLLFRG